jgi:hypothetical protein
MITDANWPIFRHSLDTALDSDPHPNYNRTRPRYCHLYPVRPIGCYLRYPLYTTKCKHLTIPPNLRYLLKHKNYYRYQPSRLSLFHYLLQLFAQSSRLTSHVSVTPNGPAFWALYLNRPLNSVKFHDISQNLRLPYCRNSPGRASVPHPSQSRSPSTTI